MLFNQFNVYTACLLINTVFIRTEAPGAKTKFWGSASFKKSRVNIIVAAFDSDDDSTHEQDLDYESRSLGH